MRASNPSINQSLGGRPLKAFRDAVAAFNPAKPVLIVSHHDADGLSSAAILFRVLERSGRHARVRLLGRGENAWSPEMASELCAQDIGGLIVADCQRRPESACRRRRAIMASPG